jgi:Transposase DDE domain group 1
MRLLHDPLKTSASFDDPNLVSRAGLVPVMGLAERAGLEALAGEHVQVGGPCGANAAVKVGCLVAGMAAGADSIDDMDVLRHGAMGELFDGIRAPSTLGSFLRAFHWGNVRQVEAVSRRLLAGLAARAPLLPGGDQLAFVDMDSSQRRVYGHRKQGAAFGHTKIQGKTVLVRGLSALAAAVSTPGSAPLVAATRLRGGSANTARGAASLLAEAAGAAREAGATGMIVARMDSGYYNAGVIGTAIRAGVRFSVTARLDPAVKAAIAAIPGDAWTAIKYPQAIWDELLGCWESDAEVAEIQYTAFAAKKDQAVTARLIVRRVRDQTGRKDEELFPVWRYHPVLTDSPFELICAESQHRDHAVVEQFFADWTAGPLAHLPSGKFAANAAWLALAGIAHNLLRAAGTLAGQRHAKARGATIRADLIDVAARIARHGRGQITLHLPEFWHREHDWMDLFRAGCGPPRARAA